MTQEKKYNLIVAGLAVLFFLAYSFLVWSALWPGWFKFQHFIFNWPDENANYFFAQLFVHSGRLSFFEPLNLLTSNLLHTRSINVVAGSLVPMAWLPNLVIFGLFFKLLGSLGVLLLTPALASLTVYLIYRLSYYIFKDLALAFLIALLLFPLAPWLYFANLVMLPTILFIFLLVTGFFFLAKSFKNNSLFGWLLAILFLSVAVLSRPTEIVWVSLLTIFVLYLNRRHLNYKKIIMAGLLVLVLGYLFLWLNKITYGRYLAFGYSDLSSGSLATELSSQARSGLGLLLMPFGFHLKILAFNVWKYFVGPVYYHWLFALAGLILLGASWKRKALDLAWQKYLFITPFIFLLLFLFYGSWNLADPLVKGLNTISISYVRYWLPLYIWILPLTAYALLNLFKIENQRGKLILLAIFLGLTALSWQVAFYSQHDGLLKTRDNLVDYYRQYEAVSQVACQGSIIITERSDKIFWPEYKVIVLQGDLPLWSRVQPLLPDNEVYYYGTTQPRVDITELYLSEPLLTYGDYKLFKVETYEPMPILQNCQQ